jgi:hypothetical protein
MPEKRQFFLENAGVFAFPMGISGWADQLFFSRQIGIDPITGQEVPINGGEKGTGNPEVMPPGLIPRNARAD